MTKKILEISGRGVPVVGNDIDTDQIVPARYLKEITFDNMGDYLFADIRFDEKGNPKVHPLNTERFQGASILIVNKNFGCGSSREHAPQAIKRFGIKAIIGESFAEIFAGNCKEIGIPVMTASSEAIESLQSVIEESPHFQLRINLETKVIQYGDFSIEIELPESRQKAFVEGSWDVLSLLKSNDDKIANKHSTLPY